MSVSILNLGFLANNLLNVCCGLGDLGCISFILWGFEDRECIFEMCEIFVGARMHGHFEGIVVRNGRVDEFLSELRYFATNKLFGIVEIMLLRNNVLRAWNFVVLSGIEALSNFISGPILNACGIICDVRLECAVYCRSILFFVGGGVIGCTLFRGLMRI